MRNIFNFGITDGHNIYILKDDVYGVCLITGSNKKTVMSVMTGRDIEVMFSILSYRKDYEVLFVNEAGL